MRLYLVAINPARCNPRITMVTMGDACQGIMEVTSNWNAPIRTDDLCTLHRGSRALIAPSPVDSSLLTASLGD